MKRILMVDDVATNLRCATEILKDNYEITAVKSGKKALELLENMIPDLMLLDVNMPEMSGFELFERIRKIPELSHIPTVLRVWKEAAISLPSSRRSRSGDDETWTAKRCSSDGEYATLPPHW